MDPISIRPETAEDHSAIGELVQAAFAAVPESDQQEAELVARLRRSPAYVPELALVAESAQTVVGHILLTRVHLVESDHRQEVLALAPVSVAPAWQRQGIGAALIQEAHRRAIDMGFQASVLIGHPQYYPRFGYLPAAEHQITFPFEAPSECCMVHFLAAAHPSQLRGQVEYPAAFFG